MDDREGIQLEQDKIRSWQLTFEAGMIQPESTQIPLSCEQSRARTSSCLNHDPQITVAEGGAYGVQSSSGIHR